MGITSYFVAGKEAPKKKVDEKLPHPHPMQHLNVSTTSFSSRVGSDDGRQIDDIKHQVILNYLWQKQRGLMWISDTSGQLEGVIIRKNRNEYLCRPPALGSSLFARAMSGLNVQAAMTINSSVIEPFLTWSPDAVDVPLTNGLRIQILPTLNDLYRARRHQYAAFIASEALLVVWDDDPTKLFDRAKKIEDELLAFVWNEPEEPGSGEKPGNGPVYDPELGQPNTYPERPIVYYDAFLVGCAACLLMFLIGLGYAEIVQEVVLLKSYISLTLLLMTPVDIFLSLFFVHVVIKSVAQLIGPVQQTSKNSKFFSAVAPTRLRGPILPHVTIQMPVYKEGLGSVIAPTIVSLKKAISTYELQGGSANILVHDDGLQVISQEDRQLRMDFYADHGIGWTSRPKDGKDGYVRKGKFKKASNMNYGLALSNAVEEMLNAIDRPQNWSQVDEVLAYEDCLQTVLDKNPEAWAEGNIRVGDYILIIDSDTRVPEDCLIDAASEMEQSPSVAIIQFSSGVMQVSYNFFENGITFFTNLVYTAIRFGVSSGDVAAFVGHNAILRWSALQEVSFIDEEGKERFWAETCVSEDFDMALRLQLAGYTVRMAAWADDGFKEGVSLTVYDELTRWQKYAYGCNELVFNPIRTWPWKSPFTPLFRRFVCSGMPLGSKINIISYIGTYYAIGSTWIMTLVNYFAVGLFNGYLDKWYMDSWKIWIAICVIFSYAGIFGLAIQRHRTGEKSFVSAVGENFKWFLMMSIFFGGLSVHMSQAILCQMFEINMSWGATSKEVEFSNFFLEVPKVLSRFKYTFAFCTFLIAMVVIFAFGPFIPWSYNITQFIAIFPLVWMAACHLLLPVALNPEMMTFSW